MYAKFSNFGDIAIWNALLIEIMREILMVYSHKSNQWLFKNFSCTKIVACSYQLNLTPKIKAHIVSAYELR